NDYLIRFGRLFGNRFQAADKMALLVVSRYDNADAFVIHIRIYCMARRLKKIAAFLQAAIAHGIHFWRGAWWHKAIAIVVAAIIILFGAMFGIAKWYVWSERNQPLVLGASFVSDYASYLGVDPHATFTAMLDDLHIRHFRLVSYWSDIERSKGTDDFSELDWEFSQAAARGAKITLAIGLRQPRWPECHMPDWATSEPKSVWQPQL